MTFSGEFFFPSKVPEFQLSSTTFPCIFFLPGLHFVSEKNKDKIFKHNDHNKTEQEHFSQKNDAGECFST